MVKRNQNFTRNTELANKDESAAWAEIDTFLPQRPDAGVLEKGDTPVLMTPRTDHKYNHSPADNEDEIGQSTANLPQRIKSIARATMPSDTASAIKADTGIDIKRWVKSNIDPPLNTVPADTDVSAPNSDTVTAIQQTLRSRFDTKIRNKIEY